MLLLATAHQCHALALLGQKHKGLPLVDLALPSSCTTGKPDVKLCRSPFSPIGRLYHCLLFSWLLATTSTIRSHSERPDHPELESDVPIPDLHWVQSSFLRPRSLQRLFAKFLLVFISVLHIALAYFASPGLTTIICHFGILLILRIPATKYSILN